MRMMISLSSGFPGTMGMIPFFVVLSASSRRSSRMPALRALASKPWQWKHVSDMMGRMSRLNDTRGCAAGAAMSNGLPVSQQSEAETKSRRTWGRENTEKYWEIEFSADRARRNRDLRLLDPNLRGE